MKTPAALEPEFTAKDWSLVEEIASGIEEYFLENPQSNHANFIPDRDPRIERRHWNEAVRRARAAGWHVKPDFSNVFISRPPLGEVETAIRFTKGQPATNLAMLVEMIGGTQVEAVLDVYLDDRGVERLLTMHRLGVTFASGLRLLTSAKGAKHLSKSFVTDAFIELGCDAGDARRVPASGHEGRLLLLAGHGVIALGCSLNGFNVNERPHRNGDRGDWAEFEKQWQVATPL